MAEKIDAEALQFGQMLQGYREQAKVTQQEIADATGLTKNYISSIERGVHKCNAQTFIVYAKKCGASLDEMAGLVPKSKLKMPFPLFNSTVLAYQFVTTFTAFIIMPMV